jgi:hypothetical protein
MMDKAQKPSDSESTSLPRVIFLENVTITITGVETYNLTERTRYARPSKEVKVISGYLKNDVSSTEKDGEYKQCAPPLICSFALVYTKPFPYSCKMLSMWYSINVVLLCPV